MVNVIAHKFITPFFNVFLQNVEKGLWTFKSTTGLVDGLFMLTVH